MGHELRSFRQTANYTNHISEMQKMDVRHLLFNCFGCPHSLISFPCYVASHDLMRVILVLQTEIVAKWGVIGFTAKVRLAFMKAGTG